VSLASVHDSISVFGSGQASCLGIGELCSIPGHWFYASTAGKKISYYTLYYVWVYKPLRIFI